jgi:hypothetical protein
MENRDLKGILVNVDTEEEKEVQVRMVSQDLMEQKDVEDHVEDQDLHLMDSLMNQQKTSHGFLQQLELLTLHKQDLQEWPDLPVTTGQMVHMDPLEILV